MYYKTFISHNYVKSQISFNIGFYVLFFPNVCLSVCLSFCLSVCLQTMNYNKNERTEMNFIKERPVFFFTQLTKPQLEKNSISFCKQNWKLSKSVVKISHTKVCSTIFSLKTNCNKRCQTVCEFKKLHLQIRNQGCPISMLKEIKGKPLK